MCVLSYVASADSAVITVAILITLASLLTVTIVVFVKRKTLLRLLFDNKKSTLEKFRRVCDSIILWFIRSLVHHLAMECEQCGCHRTEDLRSGPSKQTTVALSALLLDLWRPTGQPAPSGFSPRTGPRHSASLHLNPPEPTFIRFVTGWKTCSTLAVQRCSTETIFRFSRFLLWGKDGCTCACVWDFGPICNRSGLYLLHQSQKVASTPVEWASETDRPFLLWSPLSCQSAPQRLAMNTPCSVCVCVFLAFLGVAGWAAWTCAQILALLQSCVIFPFQLYGQLTSAVPH